MAEIVNLRRVKKQRDREAAEARAAENRVRHGRTKAEKRRDADDAARRDAALDGHALIDDPDTPPPDA